MAGIFGRLGDFFSAKPAKKAENQSESMKIFTPCLVDFSESPEMENYAKGVARFVESVYPKVQQKLDPSFVLSSLPVVFKKDQYYPGLTAGVTVYLSSEWFKNHPEDLGAVIHEITHVIQGYPAGQPSWIMEGIADYMRFWLEYKTSWSYPHCGRDSPHYTSGYACAAAFLRYIERVYDKDIVPRLNAALRTNRYNDAIFQASTGKTLQELWQESLSADCKGGTLP